MSDPSQVSNEPRAASVRAARATWIERLTDTTRRNNLLYFRELKVGTIALDSAKKDHIDALLAGESVSLAKLTNDPKLVSNFKQIARKAQSNLDEKGLETLFLALGIATWNEETDPSGGRSFARPKAIDNAIRTGDGVTVEQRVGTVTKSNSLQGITVEFEDGLTQTFQKGDLEKTSSLVRPLKDLPRDPLAPVFLLPLERLKGANPAVKAAGPIQVNEILVTALKEQFDRQLDLEGSIDHAEGLPKGADELLAIARSHLIAFARVSLQEKFVIGNFSFQKMAMVNDLRQSDEQLVLHDMIAALAGDDEAKLAIAQRRTSVDASALNFIPPENEFIILDADSSQQCAVYVAASDQDCVIPGPPGCGKSQTIANIIATLVAQGKRVLFVAEKRAALEAVHKRLIGVGLGHLAMDMHGASVSQRAVMEGVAANLGLIRRTPDPDVENLHFEVMERRGHLISHAALMNEREPASGLSPYELQAKIIELSKTVTTRTRWRGEEWSRLSGQALARGVSLMTEAQGLYSLIARSDASPWTNATLENGSAVESCLDAATRLLHTELPELRSALLAACDSTGLRHPSTVGEVQELIGVTRDTSELLKQWKPGVFDGEGLCAALSPGEQGMAARFWAVLTNGEFRRAVRTARALRLAGSTDVLSLRHGVRDAISVKDRWSQIAQSTSKPHANTVADSVAAVLKPVLDDLNVMAGALPNLAAIAIADLPNLLAALVQDVSTAHSIPRVRRIEQEMKAAGMQAILQELREHAIPPAHWTALLQHAYYSSAYDAVRSKHPEIGAFRGETHTQRASEYRAMDRDCLEVAAARVKRAHAERAIDEMNAYPNQAMLVRAEAAKRTRHKPLRKLFAEAPEVLTAVCPCWMSSPLNVSQLLPAGRQYFDVVIFDEASQVLPEDAVCAILRGKRIVVAGDQHQLPPTTFFADDGLDDDGDAGTVGYESILEAMSGFMDHNSLNWHYRSRDERLIAFSNRHIYKNRLTTFPGVGGQVAISHILVEAAGADGDIDSNFGEVDKVVELVIGFARQQLGRPEPARESLGVIAFGIKHANRIQAALDRTLKSQGQLADFLSTSTSNPWFFLKNLERVQGDERDSIIISVGYGKDGNGRLPYRFGPLLREGGERRLNVAITRAKKQVTVVSSFSHLDMDPTRSDARGVELLRLFLQFAASGGTNLGDVGGTGLPMNGFEADVYDALTLRGVPLTPQYGASEYRLDFAAQHPERRGEYVLAIECDGASYHSAPTARDRDRLRQQQLERIGWKFHRIWSTDWFLRREQEIERAVVAWRQAVEESDQAPTPPEDDFALVADGAPSMVPPVQDEPILHVARPYPQPYVGSWDDVPELIDWVRSDGLLRTDRELVDELLPLLGYQRKGTRIVPALLEAIRDHDQEQD